jgi:hypothetical protein
MTHEELVTEARAIAAAQVTPEMDSEQKDELLERAMMSLLDRRVAMSFFGKAGILGAGGGAVIPGRYLMHEDPRLPLMPEKPTLIDFFEKRILLMARGGQHLLQSARLAQKNGMPEKIVLACLLHDIAVTAHVRSDHGYYGAQLIEPYVDEEVSWAVRYHQALRFYPEPELDYEYPELYTRSFGEEYRPPAYIQRAYEQARNHKWYMSARLVTLNDLYSFDPTVKVEIGDFEDLIGRNFKQPKDGLGFDDTPSSHMWRSIIWPNNFL